MWYTRAIFAACSKDEYAPKSLNVGVHPILYGKSENVLKMLNLLSHRGQQIFGADCTYSVPLSTYFENGSNSCSIWSEGG